MATFKKKHTAYKHKGGANKLEASPQEWQALVETMVIASCIDGMLAPGEAEALAALILDTPGFEKLDNKGLAKVIEQVASRVSNEGLDARVNAIAKSLGNNSHICEEAFTLATLFVHWDGEVGDEEQTYLDALQRALHITDERASHIDATLAEWTEKTTAH